MGQRIVYCEICGDRILEADLESGKAVVVAGRDYCVNCRDKAPKVVVGGAAEHRSPPPPTTRRAAATPGSSKLDHSRPGHSTAHSSPYSHRPRSQAPLVTGVVIGAILVLLAVFAFMPGSEPRTSPDPVVRRTPTPSPTPSVDPLREAREIYSLIRDFARERKDHPEAVIARIEADLPRLAGTPFAADAQSLLDEARRARDRKNLENLEKKVSDLLARVPTEADDRDYERRAEVQEWFREARESAGSVADLAARVAEAEASYQKRFEEAAEAAAGPILDRARDLDKDHRHKQCLEALAEFPSSFEGTPAAARIATAKEEYERSLETCKRDEEALPILYRDFRRVRNALQANPNEGTWTEGVAFLEKALTSLADHDLISKQGLILSQRFEIEFWGQYLLTGYHSRIKRDLDKAFACFEALLRIGGDKIFKYPFETDSFLAEIRPDPRFKPMLEKYEKKHSADRRWLGFFGPTLLKDECVANKLPEGQGGIHVAFMIQGLAATRIGLQFNDIVVGFAGKKLGRANPAGDLDALCDKTKPGADYDVEVLRGDERKVFTVRW